MRHRANTHRSTVDHKRDPFKGVVDARCCHVDEKGVKKREYACCADNGMKGNFFHRVGTFRALWEEPRITKASMTFIADLMTVDPVQAGPVTGWDTWEFFPGPTAPGGPWGPIAREICFFYFKERKKWKTFGPGR